MTNAYPTLLVSTAVDAEVNVYQWLRDADIAVIRPDPRPPCARPRMVYPRRA